MKKEQLEKVQAEVSAWTYLNKLSPVEKNFKLKILMQEIGDTFQIYSYENEELKREYKLMVTIGLTEFCAIEYISANLEQLEKILKERFDTLLGDISSFNEEHISIIIKEKKIMQWDYIEQLPQEICGFKLFINPKEPVKVINGSYIIIDYCDFAAESNFIIYYNVFRDEFFGEAKIHRIPEITYEYDSSELKDLKIKLENKLENTLKQLRERI